MKQLGTGQEAREIKPGDVVRLLQPFRPERYCLRKYTFGIIAGVVRDDRRSASASWNQQTAAGHQPEGDELVVYLYEPNSATIYVDQFGIKALFSFGYHEVELYRAIETRSSKQD